MIQKTKVAYLERQTHKSRYKNSRSFVSDHQGDCVVRFLLDAIGFENGYPTKEGLACSTISDEKSVTAVQRAFHTQFNSAGRFWVNKGILKL
jgi:hypothetical protein